MTLSHGYRRLATLIDEVEETGIVVRSAEPARDGSTDRSETWLTATLTVEIPLGEQAAGAIHESSAGRYTAESSPAGDDSTARGAAEASGTRAVTEAEVTAGATDDAVEGPSDDGDKKPGDERPSQQDTAGNREEGSDDEPGDDVVPCEHPDCEETFETEHGMRIHHSKSHAGEGKAPHRDPERLREVYEAHDTFAEMRDALGVSVASNTVRRQLVEHGIHDPSESDSEDADEGEGGYGADGESDGDSTVASGDAVEGRAVSDGGRAGGNVAAESAGSGGNRGPETAPSPGADDGPEAFEREVADGVTAADLRAALDGASTVYDVQTALGLDREATMALLSELDLLKVVHGRVATKRSRDELRDHVEERIRDYLEDATDE